jgi:arsenate reductase (glutaredoxin)
MNVLLYGTKKCQGTRSVERFFRERRIAFQFRDIGDKPISEGELRNLCVGHAAPDLLDAKSKAFEKRGLAFMEFDAAEELLADSSLFKTPIVRLDRKVFVQPTLQELAALFS